MATAMSPQVDIENTGAAIKIKSETGCGTHTRFYEDEAEATSALTDITNQAKIREEQVKATAEKVAVADEEAVNPPEEEVAPEEEQPEEGQEEEEEAQEGGEASEDPKMKWREGSHFFPEAKARDTKFCGTHTRFEDDEAEAAPLTAEESDKMDKLADAMKDAMAIDEKAVAK